MLNLTEAQVDAFKEWKQDYLEKVDFMREVITTSNPKGYQENDFYNILGEIATIIDDFDVEVNKAHYKEEEITAERKFGFSLKECLDDIYYRISKYGMDKIVEGIFLDKSENLCRIFGI